MEKKIKISQKNSSPRKVSSKQKSLTKKVSSKKKRKRCPNGTRKNSKGECIPYKK